MAEQWPDQDDWVKKLESNMRGIFVRPATFGLSMVLLAGCAGATIDEFKSAETSGSPFTRALAEQYRQTVTYEADSMYDWADAAYFAGKGLRTASGEVVEPETLDGWNIPADSVDDLQSARGRLSKVLSDGARDSHPDNAAVAQAKFDCWVEQQEENHQPDHIAACRDGFMTSMAEIESLMSPAVITPVDYLVFFDNDSARLTESGLTTLQTLIDAAKTGGTSPVVTVVGHADRAGNDAYNLALSLRRAEAIQAALVSEGLTDARILLEAAGESSPLVETPDGISEPSNRRAVIKVQ